MEVIMKKFIYKTLSVLSITLIGATLVAQNASEYYTRYTHEFLGYLGQSNPTAVSIQKISPNDPFYKAAGYANGKSIYINEDLLARMRVPEATKLFVCAHEATHHALRHAYQTKRNVLEIEQEADVQAAHMLCTHGYRWVVEQQVQHLGRLVSAGKGGYTDGQHPTTQQQHNYLKAVLGANNNGQQAKPVHKTPAARNRVNQNPARGANKAKPVVNNAKAKAANNRGQAGFLRKPTKPQVNGVKPNVAKNAVKAGLVKRNQVKQAALRQVKSRFKKA
jgi:hypothetical protein